MAEVVLTLRDESVAVAGSQPKLPITDWLSCRYGVSLDGQEGCTLKLRYDSPVLEQLAPQDVLYLQNELGDEYEYRITKVEASKKSPIVVVHAASMLRDLNKWLVTVDGARGEIAYVSATYPAEQWWDLVIADVMARRGITHWQRGTFDLPDAVSLSLSNETVLGLLRKLVDGTVYSVVARLSGGVYYVDLIEPTVAWQPLVLVGSNVRSLEDTVDTDEQMTRAVPNGAAHPDGSPSTIAETPWMIGATVGQGVEILDPEFDTADFAMETDQFAPNADALFDGYSMVASRGTEILTLPAGGSSTRWTESLCAAGRKLYVPAQNATGEVHPYDFETEAWLSAITVGGKPVGICHAWPHNKVYVSLGDTGNAVKVIDVDTDTVVATIALTGVNSWHCLYVESVDRVFVATNAGIKVIDPSTDTVVATVTGGTLNQLYQLVVVRDELWGTGESQHVKRYTLAATPTYVGEYDVGLESGAGSVVLCYDETNDRVWVSFWVGNKLKVITRSTGAVHTTFNTATTPNAGPPRWLQAFNGVVYATHQTGRLSRWNGATPAYVDITTIDASGGEYWSLSPLGPGESTVVAVGSGKRVAWWDMSTHSVRSIRRIQSVVAGDPSSVVFGGGNSVPFAPGDFTTLITHEFKPVTSIPSPLAISVYGEIERPLSYPNARLVPNMFGRPWFDGGDWLTAAKAYRHWALESTMANAASLEWQWRTPDANSSGQIAGGQMRANLTPSSSEGTYQLKGLPAGLVLQPGDHIDGGSLSKAGYVIQRAVVDGSGNVDVLAVAVGSLVTNDAVTIWRPLPSYADDYLTDSLVHIVHPTAFGFPAENKVLGDVYLRPTPATGLNLYLSFWAGMRGLTNDTDSYFDLRVLLRNWADTTTIATYSMFDDAVALSGLTTSVAQASTGMNDLRFTVQVVDPSVLTDWRYRVRIQGYSRTGGSALGDWAMTLYWQRMSMYWATEPLDAFKWSYQGAMHKAWDAASDALFERSEPLVNYRVQVEESDPAKPFALGARCDLRDPPIRATPKVVAWRRMLERGSVDLPEPELELDNRTAALTRQLVQRGSL